MKVTTLPLLLALLVGLPTGRTATGDIAQSKQTDCSNPVIPQDFKVIMENAGALETIDYYVRIGADGNVELGGRTFEVDIANARTRIGIAEVQTLVCAIERANYFSLRSEYADEKSGCAAVSFDAGSVITSVNMNGKFKRIDHYHGCHDKNGSVYPSELTALEKQIESIVNLKLRR